VIKGKNKLFLNQLRLPAVMMKLKADRYLFPAFPVPLHFSHPQTYGLIADMACYECPQTMKRRSALFFQKGYTHTVKVCRKVITISETSRDRIKYHYGGVGDDWIVIAPCAANRDAVRPEEEEIKRVREKYALPGTYWLCLCTLEPRKNLPMLLQAYRELRDSGEMLPPLVLAGRDGWKNRILHTEIDKLQEDDPENEEQVIYTKNLYVTGAVPEEDLPGLYAGAECFIFPSRYEGFGLPPLEAQSYGVRKILVSDIEVLRNVMGNTAFYFKNDPEDLKKVLLQLKIWQGCGENKMARNVERFSWEDSARKIWEAMQ
jgi:glycosyltransferase involved in cell wall biosynthesis